MKKITTKTIGYAYVDSWLIWLGDPCYIINREKDDLMSWLGTTWQEFCDIFYNDVGENGWIKSFMWTWVCVNTTYGDWKYDVKGKFRGNELIWISISFL